MEKIIFNQYENEYNTILKLAKSKDFDDVILLINLLDLKQWLKLNRLERKQIHEYVFYNIALNMVQKYPESNLLSFFDGTFNSIIKQKNYINNNEKFNRF